MRPVMKKARDLRHGWWIVSFLLLFAASCGGSGTSPATANLTGTWTVTEKILTADSVCASAVNDDPTHWTAEVTQSGNDVTVHVTSGENAGSTFTGTLDGDKIDWQGSYPTSGGTTTVTGSDVTATDTSLSGTSSWEWSDGFDACSGTTQVTGTKS